VRDRSSKAFASAEEAIPRWTANNHQKVKNSRDRTEQSANYEK
jgi:hypothetical protein